MERKLKDFIESFSAASFNLGYYLGQNKDKKDDFVVEGILTPPKTSAAGAVKRPTPTELARKGSKTLQAEEQGWEDTDLDL